MALLPSLLENGFSVVSAFTPSGLDKKLWLGSIEI
jgi:hypothetical protein